MGETIMNTRLLKVKEMREFCRWLSIKAVPLHEWQVSNPVSNKWERLEKQDKEASERFQFCIKRKRGNWREMYLRINQNAKALDYIQYILGRRARKQYNEFDSFDAHWSKSYKLMKEQ